MTSTAYTRRQSDRAYSAAGVKVTGDGAMRADVTAWSEGGIEAEWRETVTSATRGRLLAAATLSRPSPDDGLRTLTIQAPPSVRVRVVDSLTGREEYRR